jgi:uncharacterized protein (DUF305 family)
VTLIRRTLVLPAALVAALAVASCGADAGTPSGTGTPSASTPPVAGPPAPGQTPTGTPSPVGPPGTGPANIADLEFANTMTFYHRYEEVLADLVPTRAKAARVKTLAATITKAQAPEITRMAGWLVGGGMPAPTVKDGEVIGHVMAGMGGPTKVMLSKAELTALGKATGAAFDRMWLQLMIRHHEGAAVTAKAEVAKGINAEARALAQSVIARQSPQIVTMKSLLAGIPG